MEETLRKSPWKLIEMAKLLASLQAQIHSHTVTELIPFNKAKRKQIELNTSLSKKKKEILLNLLDNLPKGNVFCHGDIHPNNIIITSNGAQVIDWSCAVSANQYIDIFKTVVNLPKYNEKSIKIFSLTRFFEHLYIKLFIRIYLSHYVQLTNSNMSEIKHWLTLKDLETLFLLQ
jgi:thiamine kinase-like enzyme